MWCATGNFQSFFDTKFPATWTDDEGGVGTLADLIADSYLWIDMTSLKCNVTSPVGYNYQDYYDEPYFADGDGNKANSFNEIANICMKPRGNSLRFGNQKSNVEGTFTFDIYNAWVRSRTMTVNFKIIGGAPAPQTFDASGLTYTVIPGTSTVSVSATSTALSGSVSIPEVAVNDGTSYSVVAIDECAFAGCTDLTSLTIAKSVNAIGNGAFKGCDLTQLFAIGDDPIEMTNAKDVFAGIDFDHCILYVPSGCAEAYRKAEGWRFFNTIVELAPVNITMQKNMETYACNFRLIDFRDTSTRNAKCLSTVQHDNMPAVELVLDVV